MRIFSTPKNRWGWLRLLGILGAGIILLWTVAAALLRGLGEIPWLAWSGYHTFLPNRGLEWLTLFAAAGFAGGWLEAQEHETALDAANHRENERQREAQREETLRQFHAAVENLLAGMDHHAPANLPSQTRAELAAATQTALQALDGKGRGEVIRHLHAKKLIETSFPELAAADFSGALLHNARLNGIHLAGADLSGAKIEGAHLAKCNLPGANLAKAFIQHSDLHEAVLAGCNLERARLVHVDLEGADLRGAALEGAFFKNANLRHCAVPASLDQATLIETTLPDGKKVTNPNGREYLKQKEYADLVDRL